MIRRILARDFIYNKSKCIVYLCCTLIFTISCTQKSSISAKPKREKDYKNVLLDKDEFLDGINNKAFSNLERKKENKAIANGNWLFVVDNNKISKKAFEDSYKEFLTQAGDSVSELDFVFIFLQDYLILPEAKKFFLRNNANYVTNFLKKQIAIQYYITNKLASGNKKEKVSEKDLLAFYTYLVKNSKQRRKLSFKKDKDRITRLYRISKMNKAYLELEHKIKGKYSIVANDEWESGIVEKYKKGSFDKAKALSKGEYKKYWLYKIRYAQKTNFLYIKDIEHKIRLSKKVKPSRDYGIMSKGNKEGILRSFLLEELIYLDLRESNFMGLKRESIDKLLDKFIINYYLVEKLKLDSNNAKKRYIEEFVDLRKIKVNKQYFD